MPVLPAPESSLFSCTTGDDTSRRLERIARTSVRLAALGPQLAALAEGLEQQAKAQADRCNAVVAAIESLSGALDGAVGQLQGSAGQVQETLTTVERIANHTRILAFNASIEAARAGESGRAFSVVVDEVKRLADHTGETTGAIEGRVQEMLGSIKHVSRVARSDVDAAGSECSMGAVRGDVRGISQSAGRQLESAHQLSDIGDDVNQLTEVLLLGVGAFRFPAHARAEAFLRELVEVLGHGRQNRATVEEALARWLERYAPFELAYCTDGSGRQFVDNLRRRDGAVVRESAGLGHNWSDRPWYRQAIAANGVISTDLYRSAATGDHCFTVAAPLRGEDGGFLGVVAADVNFRLLLSEA